MGASIFGKNTGSAMAENNQYIGRYSGSDISLDEAIRDALKHVPHKSSNPQYKIIELRVSKGRTIPKYTVVVLELMRNKI